MENYKLITGLISLMIGVVLLVFIMNMAVTVDDETETENHSRSNDDNMLPDSDEDDMTSRKKKKYVTFEDKHIVAPGNLEQMLKDIRKKLTNICANHPDRKYNTFIMTNSIGNLIGSTHISKKDGCIAENCCCLKNNYLLDAEIKCTKTPIIIWYKEVNCRVIVSLDTGGNPIHLESIDIDTCKKLQNKSKQDSLPFTRGNFIHYEGKCKSKKMKSELK